MDTSKKYIEMCEKAGEIQDYQTDNWNEIYAKDGFRGNSIFAFPTYKKICNNCEEKYDDGGYSLLYCHVCGKKLKKIVETVIINQPIGDYNWLPRQDQLQNMLYNPINTNAVAGMFKEIYDYGLGLFKKENTLNSTFNSGEQLWLAFVMKEKYNKEWNGKNWE